MITFFVVVGVVAAITALPFVGNYWRTPPADLKDEPDPPAKPLPPPTPAPLPRARIIDPDRGGRENAR